MTFLSLVHLTLETKAYDFLNKKVQGKDRLVVRTVAEMLGLEGSYIPRTYIEQIQLEKLVNEVMV